MIFGLFSIPQYGNDIAPSTTPPAVVHVYRPASVAGFAWVFHLYRNNEKTAKIKNGKHLVLNVAAGETTFRIKKQRVHLKLEPGKHYYLRSSLTRNAFLGRPELVEVSERQAKYELGL